MTKNKESFSLSSQNQVKKKKNMKKKKRQDQLYKHHFLKIFVVKLGNRTL